MPQLNLTWWIVKFIMAWASFFIVSSIIMKTNMDSMTPYKKTSSPPASEKKWKWY